MTAPFLAALLLAGGFFLFVAWDQSHWWRIKEDYSFGWIVPAFVAFVIHDRWPKITAAAAACGAPGSARMRGFTGSLASWSFGLAMLGGALLFLIGAFYRAGAGASLPGTLALTLGSVAIALALFWFNAPRTSEPAPGTLRTDARVGLVALFVFPVLVWLVSAPMVSIVESQLNLFLLHKVVSVVSFVFDLLGLPLEQQGNVLVLPNGGSVGVEDACSGIRSLTGCLFAGSFLAAVFLDRLWKKVALVSAALVLAFVTNLCRGLFLTAWAYNYGAHAIEGTVHDAAGYSVMGLTVIGLLCLLPIFNFRFETETTEPT